MGHYLLAFPCEDIVPEDISDVFINEASPKAIKSTNNNPIPYLEMTPHYTKKERIHVVDLPSVKELPETEVDDMHVSLAQVDVAGDTKAIAGWGLPNQRESRLKLIVDDLVCEPPQVLLVRGMDVHSRTLDVLSFRRTTNTPSTPVELMRTQRCSLIVQRTSPTLPPSHCSNTRCETSNNSS